MPGAQLVAQHAWRSDADSGVELACVQAPSFGWVAGLYFYRRPDQHILAQLVWGSGVLTPLLFLLAVLFLVTIQV